MIWVLSALAVVAVGLLARGVLAGRVPLDALPDPSRSTPGTGLAADPAPEDLDRIRFDTALRGYDPLAVDRHLDQVRDHRRALTDWPAKPPDDGASTTPPPAEQPEFEVVLRGYRMDQVDEVLAALTPTLPVSAPLVAVPSPGTPSGTTEPPEEAPPTAAAGPAAYRPPTPLRRLDWLAVAGYALAAFWLLSRLFADVRGGYLSQGVQDQQAFEWYFGAAAHAVATGGNPLLSDLLNHPAGVNLLANASVLGLSLPLVPVTWLAGPQLTFALVEWIGFGATATCWYLLLVRRLHLHRAAAAVGGALAGFSPAMVSHGNGHPNFLAQFLVPVLVDRILDLQAPGRNRRQTVVSGIVLGLLVVWQLWMGEEVLLFGAIGMAIVGAVGLLHRQLDWRRMLPGLLVGAATAALLFAFPLWWQFRGPQSYTSMWNPVATNDLAALWGRATRTWFADPWAAAELSMNRTEENAFFGIPLWLFAIGTMIVLWRLVVVRAAAVLVVVTAWLSLGSDVTLHGRRLPAPALWPLVSDLPLVHSLLATRLTLITAPGLAILLAVALDRALRVARDRRYAAGVRSVDPRAPLALTAIAAAVALAPVVPTRLWVDPRPAVPAFFTSGHWRDWVDDGAVLAVPPPDIVDMAAVDWQATARWEFPLVEGYFLGPDGSGTGTGMRGAPRRAFSQWMAEVAQTRQPRTASPAQVAQFRADLAAWHVDLVVLPPRPDALVLEQSVTSVLGPPAAVDDVLVWDVRT